VGHDGVRVLLAILVRFLNAVHFHCVVSITLSLLFFKFLVLATTALGFQVLAAVVGLLSSRSSINFCPSHLGIFDHGIGIRGTRTLGTFACFFFLFLSLLCAIFFFVNNQVSLGLVRRKLGRS
jgi:hypothetical protein